MKSVFFNRNPLVVGKSIEQPSQELVKNTLGLWNCSVEDALKYGGDLTRAAIGAMNLQNKHKYIVVDTKVHMLMPGFCPAIPGWHTDGVPRGEKGNSVSAGLPDISLQEEAKSHKFHLLVTGKGCLTEFVSENNIQIDVPDEPSDALYSLMTKEISIRVDPNAQIPGSDTINVARARKLYPLHYKPKLTTHRVPSCSVVEFDWWDIHQGTIATEKEWRFLIRVCETDLYAPKTDLREIVRTQQNVYIPHEFGW